MPVIVTRRPYPPSLLSSIPLDREPAPAGKKLGKRTASTATASGHGIPDDTAVAPAAASLSVAKRGNARVESGGRAQPATEKPAAMKAPTKKAAPAKKKAKAKGRARK